MVGLTMASPRILIIDDDPVLLEVLREAIELRLQPSRVEGTTSSADALARLTVDSYDLVLCDWRMPSANGMALLEEIRMVRPGVPVVLMTGDIRESVRSQAAEKGAFAFLRKPFDRDEVIRIIRAALPESTQ
jgi:DNA-binding NtrC family response regulator